ncbi:hypothetical protein ALP16_101861 [Pseudomonas savastanoi]|uniref:Uncharacterized protein n=1 Tax=Pseudomonas savastanoi TaxID=29438 RepID=A0A3M6A6B3_PSESS|nr:hypothetical protein ALO74_101796 [Pseudomonas syringae pv. cunninghamiae]RMV12424.1 hypothetical protein ALP17_107314 [Pseudomonas savastanoi]RMV14546.1 hypothetical protein ALP16_101861 [Pseudomonas savastanoi]RMV19933.1 hypothetical protein ALP15_101793 [Pseudomonas savastanoi]
MSTTAIMNAQYGEIVPNKPTAIASNKKTINESPSLPMSVSC